ncbi:tellurite resistance/C4-dicarboxylate transporter family protein [Mycobacterium sp.]|uniref:tellurite resistance/C4-dicarboxylate transporter family protein n=1 Tax=Mycobacterium sp. TaxID=1785 RepID=UPI003C752B36
MNLRSSDIEPPPDVFAAVMATGIVSVGARDHHYFTLSDAVGGLASLSLGVLVVAIIAAAAARIRKLFWDLTDPDTALRLFTFVAACAVLDTRLSFNLAILRVLGVLALLAWLVLIVLTVRNMSAHRWSALRDHAHGAWELASVGTSGLVIVMSEVSRHTGHRWWLLAALPIWWAAISIYALMTWLILWRAGVERRDRDGFAPDSWIMMGALAIATLAGDGLHQQLSGSLAAAVRTITIVTWVAATLWIPPLIYFGLHRITQRPDVLQFTGAWWSLVFPLGMYSVATEAMAAELSMRSLQTISLVFFWDAFAAWLIVAVAGLLRLRHVFGRQRGPSGLSEP